jgi:hypothetical protein
MRCFSVRTLMTLVLLIAIGLAALRNANGIWAAMMLTVACGAVASAVMGALILRGKERYGWAGFAVFGGGYLAIAIGPCLGDAYQSHLGTTAMLDYVQTKVRTSRRLSRVPKPRTLQAVLLQDIDNMTAVTSNLNDPALINLKKRLARLEVDIEQERVSEAVAKRWLSFLPGAVNAVPFFCVGHSLFALCAGMVGIAVARWFYARRERQEASHAISPARLERSCLAGEIGNGVEP